MNKSGYFNPNAPFNPVAGQQSASWLQDYMTGAGFANDAQNQMLAQNQAVEAQRAADLAAQAQAMRPQFAQGGGFSQSPELRSWVTAQHTGPGQAVDPAGNPINEQDAKFFAQGPAQGAGRPAPQGAVDAMQQNLAGQARGLDAKRQRAEQLAAQAKLRRRMDEGDWDMENPDDVSEYLDLFGDPQASKRMAYAQVAQQPFALGPQKGMQGPMTPDMFQGGGGPGGYAQAFQSAFAGQGGMPAEAFPKGPQVQDRFSGAGNAITNGPQGMPQQAPQMPFPMPQYPQGPMVQDNLQGAPNALAGMPNPYGGR